MKIKLFCLMALFIALNLVGCSDKDDTGATPKSIALSRSDEGVSMKTNRFGIDLFCDMMDQKKGENFMICPLSISTSLAMLANGASGETRDEILRCLQMDDLSMDIINNYYKKLAQQLCTLDPKVSLSLINSFWHTPQSHVSEEYEKCLSSYFDADVKELYPSSYKGDVNSWVMDKSHGLLTGIVLPETNPANTIVLNAMYLNGPWGQGQKFDKKETKEDIFYNSDGSESKTLFMRSEKKELFDIWYDPNTIFALTIKFGDGQYNMVFIAPEDETRDIDEFTDVIRSSWFEILDSKKSRRYDLRVPKLDFIDNTGVRTALKNRGLNKIFDKDICDFPGFETSGFQIDDISQSIHFKMDEEGAEAAAVVHVIGGGLSILGSPDTPLILNHPFVYAIYEKSTGSILFMGKISKL